MTGRCSISSSRAPIPCSATSAFNPYANTSLVCHSLTSQLCTGHMTAICICKPLYLIVFTLSAFCRLCASPSFFLGALLQYALPNDNQLTNFEGQIRSVPKFCYSVHCKISYTDEQHAFPGCGMHLREGTRGLGQLIPQVCWQCCLDPQEVIPVPEQPLRPSNRGRSHLRCGERNYLVVIRGKTLSGIGWVACNDSLCLQDSV